MTQQQFKLVKLEAIAQIACDLQQSVVAAAEAAGVVNIYADHAEAVADLGGLSEDDRVLVLADENNQGRRWIYKVESASLASVGPFDSTASISTDAENIGFDNTDAELPGDPDNVQAALDVVLAKDGSNVGDATALAAFRETMGVDLLGGFRNKLINALGTINQRLYASGAATTGANQYTVDRWRVVTSGQNLSWTESEGVRTFTAPAGGVEQVIEGSCILSGDYVLNWEGTATATVNGTARAKGEVFSLTGGANAIVRFIDGTFSKPQLEEGTSPTKFEVRHRKQELDLCSWYFGVDRNAGNIAAGAETSATATNLSYVFPEMRAAPTLSAVGVADMRVIDTAVRIPTGIAFSNIGVRSAEINATITGGASGNGASIRLLSGAAIIRDAEL